MAAALALAVSIRTGVAAEVRGAKPELLGGGKAVSLQQIPVSPLRAKLERMPAAPRARAMKALESFSFPKDDVPSLRVDDGGAIYYVCEAPPVDPAAIAAAQAPAADGAEAAPLPVSPFPASLKFHSRPGAPNVLYIDFDGEAVSGTGWNTSSTQILNCVALSTDADFAFYSDAEQRIIKSVWERVSEDYAPFNVDVTTERPPVLHNRVAHCLVTRNTDAGGQDCPWPTAGGVAFVGVFNTDGFRYLSPCWAYFNNLSYGESYIAEAVSHEFGHNLSLSHDGKTDGTAYYSGHGFGDTSWSAIMGVGYYVNVSTWSRGEYYLANNPEDDLAILSGHLGYRADDHGDAAAGATPLVFTGGTNVVATTPESDPTNGVPFNKGVISSTNDVDVFSLTVPAGGIELSVQPWVQPDPAYYRGGNLDLDVRLYDAGGALRASSNPPSNTWAQIGVTVPAGTYYLYVRGAGVGNPLANPPEGYPAYASLGQYFINGRVGTVIRPKSAYNTMTLAGSFNGWNQNLANLALVSDYTWRVDVPVNSATGATFKFVANQSWSVNWGESNQGDFDLPVAGSAELGNFANIRLNGALSGTYRFVFQEQTGAYTVEYVPPVDTDGDGMTDAWETQYGLDPQSAADAGLDPDGDGFSNLREFQRGSDPRVYDAKRSAYSSLSVAGVQNNWNPAANNLHLSDDYLWEGEVAITSAAFRFKFAANGSWAVNWGEQNQTDRDLPVFGTAESGNADIFVNGSLNGSYRFLFNEQTRVYTVAALPPPDSDGDGMPDAWETLYRLNPNSAADAAVDGDLDGFTHLVEFQQGTHPWHADTDYDGLADGTDATPTQPNWTQVTLSPSVLGTVTRYGGFDVPTYTYSFLANSLYYQTGYRDYTAERGYLRFDTAALGNARIRNAVLLYDAYDLDSRVISYTLAALGTQDPRTAPSNTFVAIDAATNNQAGSSVLPANSGLREAQALSSSLQAALSERPSADYWGLALFNANNSYNAVGWSLSNVALVVTYEPLRSNFSSMTAAGTFNSWAVGAKNMRLVSDYTWQFDVTLNNAAGVRFKFAANGAWGTNWGEQNQGDFDLPVSGFAEQGNFGDIVLNGTLNGTFRFTFNEQTRAYTVERLSGPPLSNWFAMTVAGSFNNWNQAANNMTLVADYTWMADVPMAQLSGVSFKFVANSSWGNNFGEQNQTDFDMPLGGTAELGDFGNIGINGILNGTVRFWFNELTRAYTVQVLP